MGRPRAEYAKDARLHASILAPLLQYANAPGKPVSSSGPENPTSLESSTWTSRSSDLFRPLLPAFSSFKPGLANTLLVTTSNGPRPPSFRLSTSFFERHHTGGNFAVRIGLTSTMGSRFHKAVFVVVVTPTFLFQSSNLLQRTSFTGALFSFLHITLRISYWASATGSPFSCTAFGVFRCCQKRRRMMKNLQRSIRLLR